MDGRPIPTALRTRHSLERLRSKRASRRPPLGLPHPPEVAASARRELCQPRPGNAPRRAAARFLWSHATAGRFSQQGRAALPGSSACRHPLEQAWAGRSGRGTPRDSVRGALTALNGPTHMKLQITLSSSLYPRSRRYRLEKSTHETRSKVEDFERSSWSEGRTLRWFSVRSGTKTARRVGADLGV